MESTEKKVVVKEEVLSIHETVAVYKGTETTNTQFYRIDPSRYTPREVQVFNIESYTSYSKLNKWGDKKQEKVCFAKEDQGAYTEAFSTCLAELEKEDKVTLKWTHFYVTKEVEREPGKTMTVKEPERRITFIEKLKGK